MPDVFVWGECHMPRPITGNHAVAALQTFEEADLAKDGRISSEEWLVLVSNNPVPISAPPSRPRTRGG